MGLDGMLRLVVVGFLPVREVSGLRGGLHHELLGLGMGQLEGSSAGSVLGP